MRLIDQVRSMEHNVFIERAIRIAINEGFETQLSPTYRSNQLYREFASAYEYTGKLDPLLVQKHIQFLQEFDMQSKEI